MKIRGFDKPHWFNTENGTGFIQRYEKEIKIPKLLTIFAPIVIFVMRLGYDYVEVEKENKR